MKHMVQKLGMAALAGPGIVWIFCALPAALAAQAFSTTTVQGTVYLANGAPSSGTVQLSWPAFSTAAGQAVAAGRMTATIGADGFLSVNLAPNAGATPAGLYYTAVYHLSDGTTSTEYWTVPAAAQATIAQVRATVMPAAQAVQAVSKTYVDQAVLQAAQSQLTASGGNLTGPLYLNGDPGSPTQAATKHYVDNQFSQALSVNGGTANGPLTATQLGAVYQADQFTGGDFGAKLQGCINALNATYGGTCDARNFTGTLSMAANVIINKANATVNLPCATISTASQMVVTAGTRNVTLHGCASRGTTAASGNQGGTVILYAGNAAAIQAGDATYASDTLGFHLDNVVINTTGSTAATAQAIAIWRTQELHLEALYLLGNGNQTGMTLDGTGNYTGGTLTDVEIGGYQNAINGIGHQAANPATTDWVNASTFVRLHIDCPTTNGNPIAGTTGVNLLQGDGNMFSGGDVEGCATALHLGPNAQNNTIVGLRNENSTYQVVADAGSAYNNWMTGGTMFTGRLTDNGTRNSFLDTFHRSFNGMNGDWYGSQQDATVTNHYRLGIGNGNERGLQNRYQTDYGYRWTTGLTDAMAGEQFYQVLDELNNVNRLSIGQYNNGQGSTNNQTVINAAGSGAVVLNGSNNAGSGGVVFGSGGPASTTVATINNTGNAQFNGTLQVGGATTFLGSPSVKNQADAEIDYFLQAGATAPQKESVTYKDWNGASQWYLVKDTSNNWALNSAVGGVDSFKAYQSTNSGDTYIDAANNTGAVRVNYEPGSGSAFNVYGGSSSSLYASFNGTTGIKFPGLAAGSGHSCMQIDSSGYLSNTGSACASSSVGTGTAGQIAYYPGNGSTLSGMAAVPVTAGGTGATSAGAALTSLGGLALSGGTLSGPLTLASDPTMNLQATTKQYVDAAFNGSANDSTARASAGTAQSTAAAAQAAANNSVQRSGDTMAGPLNAKVYDNGGAVFNVAVFGAKADASSYVQVALTNGSSTISVVGGSWGTGNTEPQGGQMMSFLTNGVSAPFASTPYVATVTSIVDASHVQISPTPTASGNYYAVWGTDNAPAVNACELWAAKSPSHGGKCIFGPGRFLLATSPYYVVTGATDDGAYGTPAGGSGASITAVLGSGGTAGQIASYTVNAGGSGYTPNSKLQMTFSGGCPTGLSFQYGPCGWAFAYANTNSSGSVTSVTPVYAGYGFASAPTVTVKPLGGDGAAATATMSGGAISSLTVTAGGGGYPANSSSLTWYGINGAGCSTVHYQYNNAPAIQAMGTATTNGSGQVTSMTITTNSSGCTSTPTIVFGDYQCNTGTLASPVWGQCSNVAPLSPMALNVNIMTVAQVSLEGAGVGDSQATQLIGPWDGSSFDGSATALIGGSIEQQKISNLYLTNSVFGIYAANNIPYSTIEDVVSSSAVGLYTYQLDLHTVIRHMGFYGYAGWVNGGTWSQREDFVNIGGGFTNPDRVTDLLGYFGGQYNSVAQNLDNYFATHWWHPEYTATSGDFYETCAFPQTPNQRQTGQDVVIGSSANSACYPGITGSVVEATLRGNAFGGMGGSYDNFQLKAGWRSIWYGEIGAGMLTDLGSEQMRPITGSGDPYRSATNLEGAIKFTSGYGTAIINNVFESNAANGVYPTRCLAQVQYGVGIADPVVRYRTPSNACANTNNQSNEQLNPQGEQIFGRGINLYPGPIYPGFNIPIDFWGNSGNNEVPAGQIVGGNNELKIMGTDKSTVQAEFGTSNGGNSIMHYPWYFYSNVDICNPSSTGNCASFNFAGTANRTVNIPDAASTTVQGAGSATSGQVVQYVDTNGVQHYTPASSGVTGPGSSTVGHTAVWNNTSGSAIADGGAAASAPATYDFTTGAAASGLTCSGTNPYTCALPPVCNIVDMTLISGGAGGGSGATGTSSVNISGGGGGTGGQLRRQTIPCSYFGGGGATVTVTVGAHGAGGAAQSGTSSAGNGGSAGTASAIAGAPGYGTFLATNSLAGGNNVGSTAGGGGATSGTTGSAGATGNSTGQFILCGGGAGGNGAGAVPFYNQPCEGPGGGAGGGGVTAGTAAAGGAQDGAFIGAPWSNRGPAYLTSSLTGGTSGGGGGQTPTYNTTPLVTMIYSATGGTGGGGNCSGNGGAGGAGVFPGGGGAGGGGACNGSSSGAGGNGADGIVRLIIW